MMNDDEAHEQLMQMWMVVTVGPAAVTAVLFYLRTHLVAWATHHGVLVASDANPLLPLPGAGGAGLDLLRLVVVAALIVLAGAIAVVFTRRWMTRRRRVE